MLPGMVGECNLPILPMLLMSTARVTPMSSLLLRGYTADRVAVQYTDGSGICMAHVACHLAILWVVHPPPAHRVPACHALCKPHAEGAWYALCKPHAEGAWYVATHAHSLLSHVIIVSTTIACHHCEHDYRIKSPKSHKEGTG